MHFSPNMACRVRILATLLTAWLFGAALLEADYKVSYQAGIEAADSKRWDDVARHMRAAIGEQPQAGERIKIYGMRFEPYIPHYYLGLALYEQGDCAAAIAAWKTSEDQGAVKASQRKRIEAKREECRDRLQDSIPPPPPASPPRPPTSPSKPPPSPLAKDKKADPPSRPSTADTRDLERLERAARQTTAVVEQAQAAGGRLASLRDAPGAAALSRDLATRVEVVLQTLAALKTDLESARKAADRREIEAIGLRADATRRESEKIVSEVETSRREAAVRQEAQIEEVEAPQSQTEPSTAVVEEEASGVSPSPSLPQPSVRPETPAALRQAVKAFFKASYQDVIATLENAADFAPRARAVAYLLRAGARHALYLEGGGKHQDLLRAAAQDVTACRRADSTVVPGDRFFAPAFVAFFAKGS